MAGFLAADARGFDRTRAVENGFESLSVEIGQVKEMTLVLAYAFGL
jgi:hypothetical protein